jgi:ubiquinone/menaquinone biosynthesis C-methylase UbiE
LTQTVSTFDVTAATFDRHRALPRGVPEAIRAAILQTVGKRNACVLDLGAGTGRIGKAFVDADDSYVGVDFSLAMLREFAAHSGSACLVQADGVQLPFCDGAFQVVLLMQVLSGAQDWRGLLQEVRRVLVPHGEIVVGKTVTPAEGVDAQLKERLAVILEEMDIGMHEPKKSRRQSLAWLEGWAARRTNVTAATWKAKRTPKEFLTRHRTGARFAALPDNVQTQAMQKLSVWAENTFGSLDKSIIEEHTFELAVFQIG